MGAMDGELLSAQDAAALLGISPRTLRRWRQMREGPPWVPIGRKVVYRVQAVRAWLAGREAHGMGPEGSDRGETVGVGASRRRRERQRA